MPEDAPTRLACVRDLGLGVRPGWRLVRLGVSSYRQAFADAGLYEGAAGLLAVSGSAGGADGFPGDGLGSGAGQLEGANSTSGMRRSKPIPLWVTEGKGEGLADPPVRRPDAVFVFVFVHDPGDAPVVTSSDPETSGTAWPVESGCLRRSAQVAGELFNGVETVPKTGDRLSIPGQLPVGQVADVQVGDPAERRSAKLSPDLFLTRVRRHQV